MRSPLILTLIFLGSFTFAQAEPRTVFLTFDDGPDKGTDEVLQALNGSKATFFLVADNVNHAGGTAEQTRMLQAVLDAHNKVGNHTKTHKPELVSEYTSTYSNPLTPAQKAAFKKNFADNQTYFGQLVVNPAISFKVARLPGAGRDHPNLVAETNSLGLKHYSWNFEFAPNGIFPWVDKPDWQGITGVSCSHTDFPPANAIILFHDRHWYHKSALLKRVIEKLAGNQCTFALLSD